LWGCFADFVLLQYLGQCKEMGQVQLQYLGQCKEMGQVQLQ
jgi:hypothetical protein